jgi:thioredoxin 1
MFWMKRIVWLLFWLGIAAGLAARNVRGDEAIVNRVPTDAPVLLDFYSDWCAPCRAMSPVVEALANAGHAVRRVNIDENPSLAGLYGVTGIPCFVAVADGCEVDRVVGATSYQRLESMVRTAGGARNPEAVAPCTPSRAPTPARHFERPVGHRAAIVRVFCQDSAVMRSIGSGTLVKWNGRLVVLTARHVIVGAKRIIVELCTKKTHWAKVIKVDAVWDCAILELVGEPADVEPVDVELGDQALPREGDRLESCGYGPDGKLACNTGVFIGYRRSTQAPHGPDDWMVISGRARGGDSGGPVFNSRGRLVGVLWGTDGSEVVCVQAGRLHRLLDAAVPDRDVQEKAIPAIMSRTPPPPKPAPAADCCPGDTCRQESIGQIFGRKPIPATPAATVVVQPDSQSRRALVSIDAKLGSLVEQRRPAQSDIESNGNQSSPILVALCVVVGVALGFVVFFAARKP